MPFIKPTDMCACTLLADGEFSPISINSDTLQFVYVDGLGNRHVLIDKFKMDITVTKAKVEEFRDDSGQIVAYRFEIFN